MSATNGKVSEFWIRSRLEKLHLQLQLVHAAVVVAALALHRQNAERDEEIARVLEHLAGARLFHQIERTARLIVTLRGGRAADAFSWDLEHGSNRGGGREARP